MNLPFLPPQMKVLRRLEWPSRELLRKLVDSMWEEVTVLQLEVMIRQGLLEAYSAGPCLILIKTEDWPQGRELLLYGMSGRGIMRIADEVTADLIELAQYKNCSMIGGHVARSKAWHRLLTRLGGQPVSTHYVKEL